MVAVACALLAAAWPEGTRPQRHVVEMRTLAYQPATLEVAVGDTVVWVNHDVVPHTATAASGAWDSGLIPVGGSWRLVVRKKGEVPYSCTYHPTMKGKIVAR